MRLFSKINMFDVIVGHYGSFGNERGEGRFWDYLLFCVFPLLIGFLYFYASGRWDTGSIKLLPIKEDCWHATITINAIFIPLVLTLLTALYSVKDRFWGNSQLLFRQLCENSAYLVLVSMAIILGVICLEILNLLLDNKYTSAVFIGIFVHQVLTVLMILKRFHRLFVLAADEPQTI